MAIYIGEEATSRDLLPIFESLVLDLDEVRSGAIDNFAAFLKVNYNFFFLKYVTMKPRTRLVPSIFPVQSLSFGLFPLLTVGFYY